MLIDLRNEYLSRNIARNIFKSMINLCSRNNSYRQNYICVRKQIISKLQTYYANYSFQKRRFRKIKFCSRLLCILQFLQNKKNTRVFTQNTALNFFRKIEQYSKIVLKNCCV